MICCAESTPRPGTSASRWTAAWVLGDEPRHLAIERTEMVVDEPQFLKRESEDTAGRREEAGACAECVPAKEPFM